MWFDGNPGRPARMRVGWEMHEEPKRPGRGISGTRKRWLGPGTGHVLEDLGDGRYLIEVATTSSPVRVPVGALVELGRESLYLEGTAEGDYFLRRLRWLLDDHANPYPGDRPRERPPLPVPPRDVEPNSPLKRFEYIAKQHGKDKDDPGVVLDTFMLLADTAGIEHPRVRFVFASIWDAPIANIERRAQWTQDVWDSGYVHLDASSILEAQRLGRRSTLVSRAVEKYLRIRPRGVAPGMVVRVPVSRLLELAQVELADTPEMHRGRGADALWPWVARNLVRIKRRGEPLSYESTLHAWTGKGPAVAQWQHDNRIDLGRYTLAEALVATQDYAEELRRREIPDPGEVVFEFDDGWTVQKLAEEDLLEQEGRVMVHCVGNEEYWAGVQNDEIEIYSLRDDEGRPHVTIELQPHTMRTLQEMGPENSAPPSEHLRRVREWAAARGVKPDDELAPDEFLVAYDVGKMYAEGYFDALAENELSIVTPPDDVEAGAPTCLSLIGWTSVFPVLKEAFPNVSNWDWENANLEDLFVEAAEEGARDRWYELVNDAQDQLGKLEERLVDEAEAGAAEFDDIDDYVRAALDEADLPFWGADDFRYLVRRVELQAGHFWEDETG